MQNKNISTVQIFILLCTIVLPSQPLLSSHRNPNKPAIKQSQQQEIIDIDEEFDEEISEKTADTSEQVQPDKTTTASTKEVQLATPAPGMLTRMYNTIAPIILITLDNAVGTGISASTESFIKQFMARYTFTNLKNDIFIKANNILQNNEEFQNLSNEGKLEIAKELFLPEKQKKSFDIMEKETSIPYIFGQAIYTGMLNTVIPMIGTLAGFGVKIALQNLMPTK